VQRQSLKQQTLHDDDAVLQHLRNAFAERDLRALMDLYPSVLSTGTLTRDDTRRIAQTLHACVRSPQLPSDTRAHLLSFLQQVIKDLQKGTLPPHPFVFVHILGIYKARKMYNEGHALWQWLVQQEDSYVSQAVYGAAIELMAYGRQLRLPELESLYLDGLKRFPGTFAEYHLSPDAIVPNRAQPIAIANVPITLLQGILTARLLNNDWKKSYLALDTALRLYPCQLPARFFEVFLASRQLQEAYTVFLVACRAGIVLKPSHLTTLLSKVRASITSCDTLRDRIILVRAIANALYAYLEAGGSLEPIHTGQFLTSFGSLLPDAALGEDYQGDMAALRNRIITFAHNALSSLLQAGMPPSPQVFNALVSLAGRLQVPDLLRVSLQDAETAHVDLGDIGIRNVMSSAGQIGAKDLIEEYWTRIAHTAASHGKQVDWKDWTSFARACKKADHVDYFRAQLREQEHAIPAGYQDSITKTLEEEVLFTAKTIDTSRSEEFENELAKLHQQIKNIAAVVMSGQRLDIRKTPFYMFLDPERPPLANREHMQKIYDEYTIDPHQPPLANPVLPAASSPTGLPLDELRFENWASIVELMDQAYSLEQERQSKVQHVGEDMIRTEKSNPLKRDKTAIRLVPDYLRGYVKSLRNTSVGRYAILKPCPQKLIIPSHLAKAHGKEKVAPDLKIAPPPGFRRPLKITKQYAGSNYRQLDLSSDAPTPTLSQSISPRPLDAGNHNELQIMYHMFPAGGRKLVPAPASTETPAPQSILPGRSPLRIHNPPSLNYYVAMKPEHEAPRPKPKISRNPLGRRKFEKHHSFRGYIKNINKEGVEGTNEGGSGDGASVVS
jgi:hypothetical protein